MKSTDVLFAIMFLPAGVYFVGCSFNTKDKVRAATHASELILPETSLKKEITASLSQPVNRQDISPKEVKPDWVNVYIKPGEDEGLNSDFDVIPPPIEEDSIRVEKDFSGAFLVCDLEEEAQYPGGTAAWLRYLKSNMRFPDSIDNEIQESVVVKFVVDEEGNVCDVEAVKGSAALAAEAVRVIEQSSKWIPAKKLRTGRCIRSYKMQPFIIRFEEEE